MIQTIDASKIKKILVISLSNIGDVILTTPVISMLREHFPSRHMAVLVGPKAVSLFEKSETVNEVIVFDKRNSWKHHLLLMFELWKRRFDLVIDLRNTAIPFFITPRYRTSFFVDHSSILMRDKHLSRIRFLFPVSNVLNRFHFFSAAERQSAFRKLTQCISKSNVANLIVIAPGAGSDLKRWTINGFAQVSDYFLEREKTVVLLGDSNERKLGFELEEKLSRPLANLMGELTLRETAAIIHGSSLVIANDSALMHLAYELNRPTVSIFGPTNDQKYGQRGANRRIVRLHLDCTPCEKAQCRLPRRICLDDLGAGPVIQACEELLNHEAN